MSRRLSVTIALAGALALATWACDPDLPGRACSTDEDCFDDEICAGSSCVVGERTAEDDAATDDATRGDAEPTPDGGAGLAE